MEIIPAILPKDFAELEDSIEMIRGSVDFVQVDVCDGRFVPTFSWPYRKHDQNFEAILKEDRGLPSWENIEYEIDLMVSKPEEDIMQWVTAGATRIVVHVESTEHLDSLLHHVSNLVDVGLALNLDTPNDVIAPHIDRIKFIQCMGIAKIGFQGNPFDDRVFNKVKELKKLYPQLPIAVDGGVNLENAALLGEAGADRLIVGSAIFASGNETEAIHSFQSL